MLTEMGSFEFKSVGFVVVRGSQKTKLYIVWGVNQDFIIKERLVPGVYLVVILNHNNYLYTVRGVIVKLLHVVALKKMLDQLCVNISNACVNAYANKSV